jgi:hypothetical protein
MKYTKEVEEFLKLHKIRFKDLTKAEIDEVLIKEWVRFLELKKETKGV